MVGVGILFLGILAVLSVLLGALVLRQAPRKLVNQRFFIFTLATGVWVASNALFVALPHEFALVIGLLSYGAAALLALYFFLFCYALVRTERSVRVDRLIVVIGLIIAGLSMLPGVVAYSVTEDMKIITNSLNLTLYGITLITYFAAGLWFLLSTYVRSGSLHQKATLRIMLGGLLIGIITGLIGNLVLPLFDNYHYTLLGPAGALAFVVTSSFAMVRHGLFDIRLAAVRSVAYVLAIFTLASIYYLLVYGLSSVLLTTNDGVMLPTTAMHVAVALVLALIFQPIKRFFDKVTNRLFYRHHYSSSAFFTSHGRLLTHSTNLRTILQASAQLIAETLKARHTFFVIYHGSGQYVSTGTENHPRISLRVCAQLDELFSTVEARAAPVEDIEDEKLCRQLTGHGVALVLPLRRGEEPVGYLFLGEQQSSGYAKRDTTLLEAVSDELVIAVQNALSIQEIKDLNATLQERIDSATKELRGSNEKLQHLDQVKDEFISMASHQLRTPLTSVKGYISMVLEGDAGFVSRDQKKLLEEAFASSERMVRLISDFLNVSRLQTGKFMIEKRPNDLAKIITQEVEGLKVVAGSRKLKLQYRAPATFPLLELDEGKLRQVIMNFIDNAIYYSHEGGTIKVKLVKDEGSAVFTVEDQGIGVPASEQKRLFGKFFRAENARQQRPDGTGVGLFLAKKVITEHGGSIVFSSTPGKGSTFGFRLPLHAKKPPRT